MNRKPASRPYDAWVGGENPLAFASTFTHLKKRFWTKFLNVSRVLRSMPFPFNLNLPNNKISDPSTLLSIDFLPER